jgi:mevalonate kinase
MNNAKLLLLGEYAVLEGGDCLAIPFSKYFGTLTMEDADEAHEQQSRWSNRQLFAFYGHLLQLHRRGELPGYFDLDRMSADLAHGLWFKSNIPAQSGIGSSGAVVSAVTKRYAGEICQLDGNELKKTFALLENCFHGNSSGIDPLVSFVNAPVAVVSGKVHFPDISKVFPSYKLFMMSTGDDHNTMSLVKQFYHRMENADYKTSFRRDIIQLNNRLVADVLSGKTDAIFPQLCLLSHMQLNYFDDIIPGEYKEIVKYGIDNELFALKLLGSGGGFMIGVTNDPKETASFFRTVNVQGISFLRSEELIFERSF